MLIKKLIVRVKNYIRWMIILWHPFKKTAYLLATPTHDNVGDLAIVVAEERFLKSCGYEKIVNIVMGDCWDSPKCIARFIPKNALICFQGGGNMGDIYLDEQLRRILIPLLSNRQILLFPETIFYRNTTTGNIEKDKSIPFYNRDNITIFAREKKSYDIMNELYPNANLFLTPDIVLSMGVQEFNQTRKNIVFCFRDDQEKVLSNRDISELKSKLESEGLSCGVTSMIYHRHIKAGMWEEVVKEKMREISSARVLITDRLHGMIFAALTKTPCIVFGNNNHKINGVYQWINNLDYIKFVSSTNEGYTSAKRLYYMDKCEFEFDQLNFSILTETIKEKGGLM